MFYKGQTLTFQKGYANAAEDELLPVVGEVASTSQPARAPAGCCAAHADGAAPRAPQWLEHDCQARCWPFGRPAGLASGPASRSRQL